MYLSISFQKLKNFPDVIESHKKYQYSPKVTGNCSPVILGKMGGEESGHTGER